MRDILRNIKRNIKRNIQRNIQRNILKYIPGDILKYIPGDIPKDTPKDIPKDIPIPPIVKDLFNKNLRYFAKKQKDIYKLLTELECEHSRVVIDEHGNLDLIYKGKSIYGNQAIEYAQQEVIEFKKIYENKRDVRGISATYPGLYCVPRFFQKQLNKTITDICIEGGDIYPNRLQHNGHFDLLVITGIGLGLHITEILETVSVQNIIVFETDYELLKLSCYFTDWEELHNKQESTNGRSLTLVLTNKMEHDNSYACLWNELIKHPPHFPFNTVFYNHGRSNEYGKMINKIKHDQRMFLSLWGHYDDEINQINHVLHNLHNNIKWIPHKEDYNWEKPVVICGSGPSLDSRMNQIKSMKNDCIILCAGTALRPLLKNNIIPHFHIEIESDYVVSEIFDWLDDIEKLKSITLICGIQSNPKILHYFKDTFVYAKDSLSLGGIIEKTDNLIKDPTPTCTNAAIALATHYRAAEIYLFGTDFGFYDVENHHSSESEYHIENDKNKTTFKDEAKKIIDTNFEQEGYLGPCLTTNGYFTAKRRLEMCIRLARTQYRFEIFNCSDGLIIDKTIHLNNESLIQVKPNTNQINIVNKSRVMPSDLPERLIMYITTCEAEVSGLMTSCLQQVNNDKYSLSTACWTISDYIAKGFTQKYGNLQYLYRGAIWHYLLAGYSLAHACEDENVSRIIGIWKSGFIDLLTKLPNHTNKVLSEYKNKDSERLNTSILHPINDE